MQDVHQLPPLSDMVYGDFTNMFDGMWDVTLIRTCVSNQGGTTGVRNEVIFIVHKEAKFDLWD